jgi:hypothetical protein
MVKEQQSILLLTSTSQRKVRELSAKTKSFGSLVGKVEQFVKMFNQSAPMRLTGQVEMG